MELYLIRHTQPLVEKGICYGQTDLDLAPDFQAHFEAVRNQLPIIPQKVISSPLSRCRKLAEHLHPEVHLDERLMELHFGDWEMKAWNDIPMMELEPWMADYYRTAPPNGESLFQLEQRITAFLVELKAQDLKSVAVVAHGGPIRVMMGLLNDLPVEKWMGQKVEFGEVVRI